MKPETHVFRQCRNRETGPAVRPGGRAAWLAIAAMAVCLGGVAARAQELTLPVYDPANPEMVLVSSLDELNTALAGGTRIIFVAPGNYFSDTRLTVTVSSGGTAEAPRYLIYHDPANPGDETHPVHMPPEKRAIFKCLRIFGASYCVLDRLTVDGGKHRNYITGVGEPGRSDVTDSGIPRSEGTSGPFTPSCHNTLNRMLYQHIREGVIQINDGCHFNTIQNCVIRKTPLPDGDWVGICLMAWRGRAGKAEVWGTRIVNNEIYDVNDGIQLFHHSIIDPLLPDYRGTLIKNNDIYVTPAIYSDGKGNLDPNGTYSASENAIDIKASSASAAPQDWVRIENNRMWGFRFLDDNLAGSNDHGFAVVIHNNIGGKRGYILIRNNIVMDTVNGIGIKDHSNVSVLNNVFYDIKRLGHDGKTEPYENSMALSLKGPSTEVYNNLLIRGDHQWCSLRDTAGVDVKNNLIVDIPSVSLHNYSAVTADYNAYYNSPKRLAAPGTNDTVSTSSLVPGHTDRVVTRKRITGPEQVIIPCGQIGPGSPLRTMPPELLGARPGMGVNDELVPLPPIANQSPEISSYFPETPFSMDAGTSQVFEIQPEDDDGDPLSCSWKLDGVETGAADPSYEYSPQESDAGEHVMSVTVSDGRGGSAAFSWTVKVLVDGEDQDRGDGSAGDRDDDSAKDSGNGASSGGCALGNPAGGPAAAVLPYLLLVALWAFGRRRAGEGAKRS